MPKERQRATEQAQKTANKAKSNAENLRKTADKAHETASGAKAAVKDAKNTLREVRQQGRQTLREVKQSARFGRLDIPKTELESNGITLKEKMLRFHSRKLKNQPNSKQSTKHIVASLEKKGYIAIEANSEDKRSINIVITTEGKNALMIDGMKGYAFFNDLFHDFSDKELDVLWTALRKLYRYDGKEHDGFEAAAINEGSENITKMQI